MLGAVLAGGGGKRFGGDKLLLRIKGRPLILYTIERLEMAEKIDEIVLIASSRNAGDLKPLGYEVLVDRITAGPISGVYTALGLGDALVVAGDMPLLVPDFVDFLVSEFRKSGKTACVPMWENSYLEPLHTVYSRAFREILEKKIEEGSYALNRVIREAEACYVPTESLPEMWLESFFNVNTRKDLEILRDILETSPRGGAR